MHAEMRRPPKSLFQQVLGAVQRFADHDLPGTEAQYFHATEINHGLNETFRVSPNIVLSTVSIGSV